MIHPTIGRVVLVTMVEGQEQPEPALICYVHDDRLINVGGFDWEGTPFSHKGLQLLQDDDTPPESGPYAHWMPYQVEAERDRLYRASIVPEGKSLAYSNTSG